MILDFGYICMELRTSLNKALSGDKTQYAQEHIFQIGGHAAIQSIAAARAGARVSLVSALATDTLSENITKILRREGIITSAMANSDHPTGLRQIISDCTKTYEINIQGAHTNITPDQIADTMLNERHLIILHDEVPKEFNINILERAKKYGAKTLMSFQSDPKEEQLFDEFIKLLDIVIVKQDISAPIPAKEREKNACHIITTSPKGFDCYCGTYAACIQAGLTRSVADNYARIAQDLYAKSDKSGYAALPYLGDIQTMKSKTA